jgi:hypothetical protein
MTRTSRTWRMSLRPCATCMPRTPVRRRPAFRCRRREPRPALRAPRAELPRPTQRAPRDRRIETHAAPQRASSPPAAPAGAAARPEERPSLQGLSSFGLGCPERLEPAPQARSQSRRSIPADAWRRRGARAPGVLAAWVPTEAACVVVRGSRGSCVATFPPERRRTPSIRRTQRPARLTVATSKAASSPGAQEKQSRQRASSHTPR